MSTYTPVQIRCPHCGKDFVVELLEGIHITRLPDVREEILSGRFQFFTCPSCGTEVHVENDTIYTDFTAKHYVGVQASTFTDWRSAKAEQAIVFTENFSMGPDIAKELGQDFVHRVVPDLAALREKLLVWDAGLDDRVVEATKGARQRELDIEPWAELWRVSAVFEGGHVLVARLRPVDDGFVLIGHETIPNDQYERWTQGDDLDWEFSLLLDDWVVDLFILYASVNPDAQPVGMPPGPKGRHWRFEGPDQPLVQGDIVQPAPTEWVPDVKDLAPLLRPTGEDGLPSD